MRASLLLVLALLHLACAADQHSKPKAHRAAEPRRKKRARPHVDRDAAQLVSPAVTVDSVNVKGARRRKQHDSVAGVGAAGGPSMGRERRHHHHQKQDQQHHFQEFDGSGSLKHRMDALRAFASRYGREARGMLSSELEQITLKATRPDDLPVKAKHLEALLRPSYELPSELNVYYPIVRKLWGKMKDTEWRVVVKALYVLHKMASDGAPAHAHNLQSTVQLLARQMDPKSKGTCRYFDMAEICQLRPPAWSRESVNAQTEFTRSYATYVLDRSMHFGPDFLPYQPPSTEMAAAAAATEVAGSVAAIAAAAMAQDTMQSTANAAAAALQPAAASAAHAQLSQWVTSLVDVIEAGLAVHAPLVRSDSGGAVLPTSTASTAGDMEDVLGLQGDVGGASEEGGGSSGGAVVVEDEKSKGYCPAMVTAQAAVAKDLWVCIETAAAQVEALMAQPPDPQQGSGSAAFNADRQSCIDFLERYTSCIMEYVSEANALTALLGRIDKDPIPAVSIARHVLHVLRKQIETEAEAAAAAAAAAASAALAQRPPAQSDGETCKGADENTAGVPTEAPALVSASIADNGESSVASEDADGSYESYEYDESNGDSNGQDVSYESDGSAYSTAEGSDDDDSR